MISSKVVLRSWANTKSTWKAPSKLCVEISIINLSSSVDIVGDGAFADFACIPKPVAPKMFNCCCGNGCPLPNTGKFLTNADGCIEPNESDPDCDGAEGGASNGDAV